MNKEAEKIIQEAFVQLPARLQEAILAADLPEKFRTVMVKHKLRLDQAADVENETMLVMLGLEHPDSYTKNITREAELDETKAREIAENVNRMIFLPIRSTLKELHEREEEERASADAVQEEPAPLEDGSLQKQAPVPRKEEPKTDIFREKMGGMMYLPKEETTLGLLKKRPLPTHQQKAPAHDRYREPIEEADIASFKQSTVPGREKAIEPPPPLSPAKHQGEPYSAKQERPEQPPRTAATPTNEKKHDTYREQKEAVPPPDLPTEPEEKEKKKAEEPRPIVIGRLPQ